MSKVNSEKYEIESVDNFLEFYTLNSILLKKEGGGALKEQAGAEFGQAQQH